MDRIAAMRSMFCTAACIAVVAWNAFHVDSAFGVEPDNENHWEQFTLERYDREVLPYQSIRCAVTVKVEPGTVYSKRIDPFIRLNFYRRKTDHDRGDSDFVRIPTSDIAKNLGYVVVPASSSTNIMKASATSRVLNGFKMSLSAPISATTVGMPRGLFEKVGEVDLKAADIWADERQLREAAKLVVRIVEPMCPEDREALATIQQNLELERAVTYPLIGYRPQIFSELKEVVGKYPDSSYADYWRLAIAARIIGDRDCYLAKDVSDYVISVRHLIEAGKPRESYQFLRFHPNRRPEQVEAAIAAAIQSAKGGEMEQQRAAETLVTLLFQANADDRREAAKYLLQIRSKDFAHFPSVLILLRKLYLIDDAKKAEEITNRLNKEYADSFEWLREMEHELNAEDWKKLRISNVP